MQDFSSYQHIYAYIRHSKESQSEGDSVSRQKKLIKAWGDTFKRDVTLLDVDAGKSAFSAAHVETGYLGTFLKDLESGVIPSDSLLLVESLDRLSRQALLTALSQLESIITAGADVLTLTDNKLHTSATINDFGSLVGSLAVMQRAHEESETKSKRIKESFSRRDDLMKQGVPVNYRHLPHWLEYQKDAPDYLVNEHADTIRSLFSLYLDGNGVTAVANKLNASGTLRKGSTEWTASNVSTQLSDRLVLGEWKGYKDVYPTIISVSDFNAAQALKRKGTGRRANRLESVNLFIASTSRCDCGKTMNLVRPRGTRRLICSGTRKGKTGCPYGCKLYNVDNLEQALGLWLSLNIGTDTEDYSTKLRTLEVQLSSIEEEQTSHRTALDNLASAIADLGYTQALKDRHSAIERQLSASIKQAESVTLEMQQLQQPKTDIASLMRHWNSKQQDTDYRRQILRLLETQQVQFVMSDGSVSLIYQGRTWTLERDLFKPVISVSPKLLKQAKELFKHVKRPS